MNTRAHDPLDDLADEACRGYALPLDRSEFTAIAVRLRRETESPAAYQNVLFRLIERDFAARKSNNEYQEIARYFNNLEINISPEESPAELMFAEYLYRERCGYEGGSCRYEGYTHEKGFHALVMEHHAQSAPAAPPSPGTDGVPQPPSEPTGRRPRLQRWALPLIGVAVAVMIALLVGVSGVLRHILTVDAVRDGQPTLPETAVTPRQISDALPPTAMVRSPNVELDITVWPGGRTDQPSRKMSDPGILPFLPLKPGDAIRIDAVADEPAYFYVAWLDADGKAQPLWPWKSGNWQGRPVECDTPRRELLIPGDTKAAMKLLPDPPGTQTLVVMTRDTPLPPEADVAKRFEGWPKQSGLDPSTLR